MLRQRTEFTPDDFYSTVLAQVISFNIQRTYIDYQCLFCLDGITTEPQTLRMWRKVCDPSLLWMEEGCRYVLFNLCYNNLYATFQPTAFSTVQLAETSKWRFVSKTDPQQEVSLPDIAESQAQQTPKPIGKRVTMRDLFA